MSRRRGSADWHHWRKAWAGVNPVAERRVAEERAASNTVAGAVMRYLAQCERDLRPKTVSGYKQLFHHDEIPRWGQQPLSEIVRGDALELLNDKAARRELKRKGYTDGAVVQANPLLTRLRTFFGRCIANDLIAVHPTIGGASPERKHRASGS